MTVAKPPRIALTLPADTYALIARLATLQRRPKSAIAADLLVEMTPTLGRIADLLETASRNRASLPADTAARLTSLEQLMAHTASFTLDRFHAAVTPASEGEPAPHKGASRRRRLI